MYSFVSLCMKSIKRKTLQTAFTISADAFSEVKKIAKEERRSRSGVMLILIEEALEIRKQKSKDK